MTDPKLLYLFKCLEGDVVHLAATVLAYASRWNAMAIVVAKETGKELVDDGTHKRV